MDVVNERCCRLDLHKQTVVACLLVSGADGPPGKETRTFGTVTDDLLAVADWLRAAGCTQVAMESTGVYWKPVWNLLEGEVALLLANAQHVKRVPGRKTDVKDAEWLADLLRHGLLTGSVVPDRAQRELQELTRYRTTLVQERAAEVNRLHKTLEGANIKLGDVAANVVGVSGRQKLAALGAGEDDPAVLAQCAQGQLRHKRPELERALRGRVGPHQRFLLARQLLHLDFLDASIPTVGAEIAKTLLAEVGSNLRRFPMAKQFASWAGMCPGNDERAGKRRAGTTRKGRPGLRAALVEAARAASRSKGTSLAAQYRRVAARRGSKRAAVAVGHSILVGVYHVLTKGEPYRDLGGSDFDERDQPAVERRFVRRLEGLGSKVTLEPAA